jgi:hypothetical protein
MKKIIWSVAVVFVTATAFAGVYKVADCCAKVTCCVEGADCCK